MDRVLTRLYRWSPPSIVFSVVEDLPGILILEGKISEAELRRLVQAYFGDMVKYVVDVRRGVVAIGGELHADAEQILLERGSRQSDIWGANYYPGLGPAQCIEFTALINIRPSQKNPSMEIADKKVRAAVQKLTFDLIGRGEALLNG